MVTILLTTNKQKCLKIHEKKNTRTEILYRCGVSHVNRVYHGLTQGLGALLD